MTVQKHLKSYFLICSITLLSIITLSGCGGSSSPAASAIESYNGPGSRWIVDLNSNGNFTIEHFANGHADTDYTVEGDHQLESSGFTTLTATTVTGTGGPTVGDTAWAIEVPGYALLLKPSSEDRIIAMLKEGDCPTSTFTGNFVVTKKDLVTEIGANDINTSGASREGRDFFGSFEFNVSNGVTTLTNLNALTTGFPSTIGGTPLALPAGTCSEGRVTLDDSLVYLTASGGAIVHLGLATPDNADDDSFLFALPQKAVTDIDNLAGDYVGIIFDDFADTKVQPVSLTCEIGGICTGNLVTNVVTGTTDSGGANLELTATDTPSNGNITGTLTLINGEGTGNLVCAADITAANTSTKVISCVGQSPEDNNYMYNVIFVSI